MPIIKNYGFLWERKNIFRGKGRVAGSLNGYVKKTQIVDFREQIGVYVLYDRNQQIIYVGQAGNGQATLFKRLKDHMDDHLWNRWEYFSWIGFRDVNATLALSDKQAVDSSVSGFKYSDALNEIEGILIEIIEPKLNKRSGNLKNAVEYFQYIDELNQEVSNADLLSEIRKVTTPK